MYKYTHAFYDVNKSLIHYSDNTSTRGHKYKLETRNSNLDLRHFFFTYRTVKVWNDLPSEIVNSPSMNVFKARIDNHFRNELYKC